jgi:lactoylglutathione lyase
MVLRVWDIAYTVSNLERAIDFYENVLDLQKKYRFSSYAGFDCGGVEIGLAPGRGGEPLGDGPCVDLKVSSVDEAYGMLVERGVEFTKGPHDTPWGSRIALFTDPGGHKLQLVQINWPQYLAACAPG